MPSAACGQRACQQRRRRARTQRRGRRSRGGGGGVAVGGLGGLVVATGLAFLSGGPSLARRPAGAGGSRVGDRGRRGLARDGRVGDLAESRDQLQSTRSRSAPRRARPSRATSLHPPGRAEASMYVAVARWAARRFRFAEPGYPTGLMIRRGRSSPAA